ncbi:MAG: serine hydrolase [Gracilimonas sp.]|uniref:serine hydrolase n=1 Tax=Gracilimonas TaxID=649462 RepID=UPI001B03DC53|nr:serine hydrolase [Gracilimonas sp.]MBO6586035.1 serine hydrolase [Gracilimonas sp.]MBO6617032.1 serine hydrolase [Gracilimonas sp.]
MRSLSFLLLFCFLISCSSPQHPETLPELENLINTRVSELEGTFGISFKSLQDPDLVISINEDERFHAASTMKTPVIMELYRQAEQGRFSVQDSITVQNEFVSIVDSSTFKMSVSEDSEQDLYSLLGKKTSLYHLAYEMITRSSNLATNILIDFLDAKKVTTTMREIGADSIEVLRGVEDIKAYEAGLSNTTTPKDLRIMYEELAKGDLLTEESKQEILSILKQQKYNDMFPVKLPEDTPIAHKTGWITNVHHDSGIIYMPDGDAFVLVFLSKNAPNREAVLEASADIARYCYDFMSNR